MRPLLAISIAMVVLGSVKAYMVFQSSLPAPAILYTSSQQAEGVFSVDLTLTFDAVPDEFALEPASVLVQLHRKDLYRAEGRLVAGTPIIINDVDGVIEGHNSFYVKVATDDADVDSQRAVRLRVLRDGQPLVERTLWSAAGEPVEGVIDVDVPKQRRVADPHDH